MKSVIIFITLIAINFYTKSEIKNFCHSDCTKKMSEIFHKYKHNEIKRFHDFEDVYLGSCYHRSQYYDPKIKHHTLAFFQSYGDRKIYAGQFSFFSKENPYKDLTYEQIKEKLLDGLKKEYILRKDEQNSFYGVLNPGAEFLFEYWATRGPEYLYLISSWGKSHQVFCKLLPY